jgi:hypothetical protein
MTLALYTAITFIPRLTENSMNMKKKIMELFPSLVVFPLTLRHCHMAIIKICANF